ncbi:AAA family ATPase [Aliivibrio wodanis]|uniref:AAA family ATPase n=1 Tax=Aliivibrio wodanis TaxID=80852 RepID=UPI00406C6B29
MNNFHPKVGLDELGGLKNLKQWLDRRKYAYTDDAREFGLEYPKGIMMLGLPGTGKSLAAKAVSSNWQLPLLRLDMGKVFGGIVGQSEENIRNALQLAETISPCILWIDEIEKGLSGLQGSGGSDGGTTARVLGTFLTWMQEKTSPVFVLATANHIEMLPPELLRKGRVDEIFFVDLPVLEERIEILTIHLKKRNDRHEMFTQDELLELAKLSQGFTGAELEEAVKEALFMAFSDSRDIDASFIKKAIESTSPLSVTMHETIRDTRNWIKGRAVPASNAKPEPLNSNTDNKQPKLKQESKNPFIKSQG